jgi:hypothetical protein
MNFHEWDKGPGFESLRGRDLREPGLQAAPAAEHRARPRKTSGANPCHDEKELHDLVEIAEVRPPNEI